MANVINIKKFYYLLLYSANSFHSLENKQCDVMITDTLQSPVYCNIFSSQYLLQGMLRLSEIRRKLI